jgi:PIN domain nuclease of toxin-antitoxin system
MRLLLDSHTLIWSQDDTSQLSAVAVAALTDPANDRLVSAATIWEIAIKVGKGRLPLSKPFRQWIDTAMADVCLKLLPITLDHAERQSGLPAYHGDPFDRLLISQALVEGIPIIGCDVAFDAYGVNRIWD